MERNLRTCVPIACFGIALGLAMLVGPTPQVLARRASETTGACDATAKVTAIAANAKNFLIKIDAVTVRIDSTPESEVSINAELSFVATAVVNQGKPGQETLQFSPTMAMHPPKRGRDYPANTHKPDPFNGFGVGPGDLTTLVKKLVVQAGKERTPPQKFNGADLAVTVPAQDLTVTVKGTIACKGPPAPGMFTPLPQTVTINAQGTSP
jgi:hypothetical protein